MLSHWRWANVSRKDGQKQDYLRNGATAAGSSIGINGSWWGGLKLGGVRGDGEERSEEIHCCVCGVVCVLRGLRDAMKLSDDERLFHTPFIPCKPEPRT
jgi:hypothetical protein